MALVDIRRRTGYLFLAVIVGHVILISTQVTTKKGVPMLEAAVFGIFSEVQRGANAVTSGVQTRWQTYFALQEVREENERLKQQLGDLQVRLQEERGLAEQSQSLQKLLDLKTNTQLSTTGANVIAGGASPEFRTITIDKGTGEGLRSDMAVIAPAGVVGRVIQPSNRAAKVQLLIDRSAAAGALIERTRAQGVVIGTGSDVLRMDYVAGSADVKAGDMVVTSGIDGIYPKGFVIGQIQSVKRGAGEYSAIVIKPAVDFTSLEAVLIVLTPPPAAAETTGTATTGTAGTHQGRE
jgi:rod shape-determining protein MreC